VKKREMALLQHVGFFALLKKQADMHERSQGLPKQPLHGFFNILDSAIEQRWLRSSLEKLQVEHSEAT
jgi:hypothetical protein